MKPDDDKQLSSPTAPLAWWDLAGMLVHGQYWRAFLTFNVALLAVAWAVHLLN